MYVEKEHDKLNCIEFLLSLSKVDVPIIDGVILQEKYSLPEGWIRKIAGKKVVCIWLSKKTIFNDMNAQPRNIVGLMNFVRKIFKQSRDLVIWWADDGNLYQLLENRNKDYKQQQYDYQQFLKSVNDDEQIIHDDSGEWRRVLEWAGVFYGDEGNLCKAFRKLGKPVFIQDAKRQNFSTSRYVYIEDWLEQVISHQQELKWKEPIDWNKACQGRKVVLYYQDHSALLGRAEAAIEKLERVTKLAESRQKLCFYWCVSKENEQAVRLLPFELQERYRLCKQIFQKEENCIIDTINPLTVALEKADSYYGDDGIWLDRFIKEGKTTIRQSYDYRSTEEYVIPKLQKESFVLSFIDGVWIEDYYYFVSWYGGNGIFCVRRGSETARFISHIPVNATTGREALFCSIEHYDGNLFLIPTRAREIMVYDLNAHEWSNIPVSKDYAWDSSNLFSKAIRIGNILWLMPESYYGIGRLDLCTKELTIVGGWGENIRSYVVNPRSQHFINAVQSNEYICFIAWQSNHVISFSMKTGKVCVHELNVPGCGLTGICTDGDDFWIVARDGDGSVYQWSPRDGIKGKIKGLLKEGFAGQILYSGGNLWIFSTYNDSYLKYDIRTGGVIKRKHYLPDDIRGKINSRFPCVDEQYIYLFPILSEQLVKINVQTEKVELKTFKLDVNDVSSYMKEQFSGNEFVDSSFYNDNEMASYLEVCQSEVEDYQTIGRRIYANISAL